MFSTDIYTRLILIHNESYPSLKRELKADVSLSSWMAGNKVDCRSYL